MIKKAAEQNEGKCEVFVLNEKMEFFLRTCFIDTKKFYRLSPHMGELT